jgi:hypothetical protein
MPFTVLRLMLVAILTVCAPIEALAQSVYVVIIVGLGGDPDHAEAFQKWSAALADTSNRLGVPGDRLFYLAERPEADAKRIGGRSTREDIARVFDTLADKSGEGDIVFVVLIGHGSFDGRTARFNLPGPDMAPADFEALLKRLPLRSVVFVNTASASGPFVEELAAPGRTIVTATRTGSEKFATLFGGFFVEAFGGTTADADKDGRISVLEAFNFARGEVARAYEREGLMATEHALLDDDGDGKGSREPTATTSDGRRAASLSLGSGGAASELPADPKLRTLYLERRDLERRVEALKLLKTSMPPARYAEELEQVLKDLALKSREIRDIEGKDR